MSRFKYQERSAETVQSRAKQTGGDYDIYLDAKVPTVKVKEGQNDFRILPPTWSKKEWGDNWGIEVWAHGNIGPDNQSYLCPKKMKGEDCCLCDAVRDMDPEDAKQVKAKKRILAYIVNRDEEKVGPQIWNLSWSLEKDIQTRSIDKKTGAVISLDHPDHGYDISFVREGQKLNTRYVGVEISRDESPLSERESRQDAWLDFIEDTPLPSLLVFHDQEHIENVFAGKSAKKEEDEDEGKAAPSRRRAVREDPDPDPDDRPARRRAVREDPDPDPDDRPARRRAVREDPDPDPDERPARRRAVREDPDPDPDDRPARRRAVREDPDPDPDDRPARRRAVREDPDPDPDDRPARRRAVREDPDPDPDPDETSTSRAKRSLERLKPGNKK